MVGSACSPLIEPILIIEPPSEADMIGMKRRQTRKTPRALVPINWFQSASVLLTTVFSS